MKPMLIIGGPTASGKTALAVNLALRLDGEVVSADSMQIYKYMDIGSAKPKEEEKLGVPHHLIDVAHPTQNFSLNDYLILARNAIDDIHSRGKLPIMAGGTGLYINSVINNIELADQPDTSGVRQKLTEFAEKNGTEALFEKLKSIDPESAEKIHPNNVKRVIRAIEIFETTGVTMTQSIINSKKPPKYKTLQLGMDFPREVLYDRINKRVDIMFEEGLVEEVKNLVKMGCTRDNTSMQGIGYKEVLDYLEGKTSFEEMSEQIKQATRRYAKRQLTWFRRNDMVWLDPETLKIDALAEEIKEKLL